VPQWLSRWRERVAGVVDELHGAPLAESRGPGRVAGCSPRRWGRLPKRRRTARCDAGARRRGARAARPGEKDAVAVVAVAAHPVTAAVIRGHDGGQPAARGVLVTLGSLPSGALFAIGRVRAVDGMAVVRRGLRRGPCPGSGPGHGVSAGRDPDQLTVTCRTCVCRVSGVVVVLAGQGEGCRVSCGDGGGLWTQPEEARRYWPAPWWCTEVLFLQVARRPVIGDRVGQVTLYQNPSWWWPVGRGERRTTEDAPLVGESSPAAPRTCRCAGRWWSTPVARPEAVHPDRLPVSEAALVTRRSGCRCGGSDVSTDMSAI